MEQYLINTKRRPCAVNLIITTDGSTVPITIIGFDTLNANTLYFRSTFLLTGKEDITLNCPQSPIQMKVMVWANDNLPYQVPSVSVTYKDFPLSDDPVVTWIEYFSRLCGHLRAGNWVDDSLPFTVEYKRHIYTEDGREHPTPARIRTDAPVIQVSKAKFDQMTIPERIIILLHEYSHNFINSDPDNEQEADSHAEAIYKSLGYPKIEAVQAFGNIMSDTDDNYQRMLNLVSM